MPFCTWIPCVTSACSNLTSSGWRPEAVSQPKRLSKWRNAWEPSDTYGGTPWVPPTMRTSKPWKASCALLPCSNFVEVKVRKWRWKMGKMDRKEELISRRKVMNRLKVMMGRRKVMNRLKVMMGRRKLMNRLKVMMGRRKLMEMRTVSPMGRNGVMRWRMR